MAEDYNRDFELSREVEEYLKSPPWGRTEEERDYRQSLRRDIVDTPGGTISKNSKAYKVLVYLAQNGNLKGVHINISVSASALRSILPQLERKGLIERDYIGGKPTYIITDWGWSLLNDEEGIGGF